MTRHPLCPLYLLPLLFLAVPALLAAAPGSGGRAGKLLRSIDADGNGMISRAEAQTSPALAAGFDVIDANRDGQITPDELRAWNKGRGTRAQGKDRKSGFDEQFAKADSNGDGTLSRGEVEKGMRRVVRHFDEVDANRDGHITREELRGYMQARREAKGQRPQVR